MLFEMSESPQLVTIFNFCPETSELLSCDKVWIPAHTGLPACSTQTPPPETTAGIAHIYNVAGDSWSSVEDHRGEDVYSVITGELMTINELGPLPSGFVITGPTGAYQKWDGSDWVDDTETRHSDELASAALQKSELMQHAKENISLLQDAVDLDIATDEEKDLLVAWKKYRVLLNRIDTSLAPDISWPELK